MQFELVLLVAVFLPVVFADFERCFPDGPDVGCRSLAMWDVADAIQRVASDACKIMSAAPAGPAPRMSSFSPLGSELN